MSNSVGKRVCVFEWGGGVFWYTIFKSKSKSFPHANGIKTIWRCDTKHSQRLLLKKTSSSKYLETSCPRNWTQLLSSDSLLSYSFPNTWGVVTAGEEEVWKKQSQGPWWFGSTLLSHASDLKLLPQVGHGSQESWFFFTLAPLSDCQCFYWIVFKTSIDPFKVNLFLNVTFSISVYKENKRLIAYWHKEEKIKMYSQLIAISEYQITLKRYCCFVLKQFSGKKEVQSQGLLEKIHPAQFSPSPVNPPMFSWDQKYLRSLGRTTYWVSMQQLPKCNWMGCWGNKALTYALCSPMLVKLTPPP